MDRTDVGKVIKELSERPIFCGNDTIETTSGYVITTKQGMKEIREKAIEEFVEAVKKEYPRLDGFYCLNKDIDRIATELKGE